MKLIEKMAEAEYHLLAQVHSVTKGEVQETDPLF